MFSPAQLILIADLALQASKVAHNFYEVGCGHGDTTVFLKKLLDERGVDASYTVIDTFQGFLDRDVVYEVNQRHTPDTIRQRFAKNKVDWVAKRFRVNGVSIDVFKQDACTFDFGSRGSIAFCLLDVDLYLPTKDLLPKVYDHMVEGGVLIVDDCDQGHPEWNGAYSAFMEFVQSRNIRHSIMLQKLGIIRK